MSPPRAVLFDLNGTLLDAAAIGAPLGAGAAGRQLALAALDLAIAQAMVDTMSGTQRPFGGYLRAALRLELERRGHDDGPLEQMVAAARALPPFPDSAAALTRLADAGVRTGVLTNSPREGAEAALAGAGLDGHLSLVVGCDEVGAYKPDPRPYHEAVRRLDLPPADVCLVAAHWWDVLGAMRAGLRGAWVGRKEATLLETVPEPDYRAPDLASIAERIAAG